MIYLQKSSIGNSMLLFVLIVILKGLAVTILHCGNGLLLQQEHRQPRLADAAANSAG